jgi:hypothetical protein
VLGSDGQSTGIGVGQSTGLGIGGEVSRQRITVVVRCFGIGVGQSTGLGDVVRYGVKMIQRVFVCGGKMDTNKSKCLLLRIGSI